MTCARCGRDPCICLADTAASPAATSQPRAEGPASRVGTTLGRYRIEAQLGAGGMGVVYRATDTTLGRPVALKFLSGSGGPDAVARLQREARAASALDHSNIGTVYEIGEADGAPFIAMAFYEGETLRDRIARGPIPVEEIETIAFQLASALAAAHGAGVLHRDVKPANVMLTRGGGVKLLDFGLAKTADPGEPLTQEGVVLGTLTYMAPEQLRAEAVDARADLWALGVILHEMLSGKPPFAAPTGAATATRILHDPPPPLGDPPHLARLVEQLLSKHKEDRPANAALVAASLLSKKAPPPRRRVRPAWIALALVLIGGAAGGGVLLFRGAGRQQREAPPPEEPAPPAEASGPIELPGSEKLPQEERARLRVAYERGMRQFDLANYDEAARLFGQVYEAIGDPTILFNVGQALRLAGKKEKAVELYKSYLRRDPTSSYRPVVEGKIRELGGTP